MKVKRINGGKQLEETENYEKHGSLVEQERYVLSMEVDI